MWIKTNLLLAISISVTSAVAQTTLPVQMDTNVYEHEIIVTGITDYSSSSLQTEFVRKLYLGGFIDDDLKQRVFAAHGTSNLIGMDLSGGVEYRNYKSNVFGNERIGFLVRSEVSSLLSANYTKDAFGLVFYGNEIFKGDTAQLNNIEYNALQYSKVGIGLVDKKRKSTVSLNYYNISNYSELYLRRGELRSSADGKEVEADLVGHFESTSGSKFNKGFGIGVDFDYRLPLTWFNGEKVFFSCLVKNLGVMSIQNVNRYTVDSTYTLDGFSLNELVAYSNLSSEQAVLDTLGIVQETKTVTRMLPGFIQFGKIVQSQFPRKVQSFFGVRMYTSLNYNPLFYVGGQYKVTNSLKFALQGSYGGFTGFRAGAYVQFDHKDLHIGLGCEDLYGTIVPTGYGESITLRLAKRW